MDGMIEILFTKCLPSSYTWTLTEKHTPKKGLAIYLNEFTPHTHKKGSNIFGNKIVVEGILFEFHQEDENLFSYSSLTCNMRKAAHSHITLSPKEKWIFTMRKH